MNIRQTIESAAPVEVTTGSLPASRKVYEGAPGREDILVPMREIALSDPTMPSLRVYDPSGPYTEAGVSIDLDAGLPTIRAPWVRARDGFEIYSGRSVKPEDNGDVAADRLVPPCPANRQPLRGSAGKPVTQYEFAKAGHHHRGNDLRRGARESRPQGDARRGGGQACRRRKFWR